VDGDAPRLAIAISGGLAAIGLLIAGFGDSPYLSADGLNAGVVLFAIGLFGALFAVPFYLERGLRATEPDRDRRWERALITWGFCAGAVLVAGALLWLVFGLHGSSLGGAITIVVLLDGALIAGTLVAWMFSN
jgi:hypothetical protein